MNSHGFGDVYFPHTGNVAYRQGLRAPMDAHDPEDIGFDRLPSQTQLEWFLVTFVLGGLQALTLPPLGIKITRHGHYKNSFSRHRGDASLDQVSVV